MSTTTAPPVTEHYAVTNLRHRIAVLSRGIARARARGDRDFAELLRLMVMDRSDDLIVATAEHATVAW